MIALFGFGEIETESIRLDGFTNESIILIEKCLHTMIS